MIQNAIILILLFPFGLSFRLIMSFSEKKAQIPLKIAIAGGGLGGATLGCALQRKGFDVTVFEKTKKFSRFGGPIQLASNTLSCFKSISPEIFEDIMDRFTFTGTRTCGIKDGVRNKWYSEFYAIKNIADWNTLPYTGVIDRPDLQDVLLKNLKDGTILNSKAVTEYLENKDGTVDLKLSDGSEAKGFDILVGADGIWSNIRSEMWGESLEKPGTCTYSVSFSKKEGYDDVGYKVYIGPGKYFVTSDVGSGRIQWYAFLGLPPDTKARTSNLEFLREQFSGWSSEIHACFDNTPESIIEQRDLYDRRPSMMKSWSKGHVTMIGDAIHPMMPNLGQGACQVYYNIYYMYVYRKAIEDVYVLTEKLCDITDKRQISNALQGYYRQRIMRSAIVQGLSRFSSDLIINTFNTPFDFQEFLKEGISYKHFNYSSILTWFLQPFLPLIFYAQFGYIYSFSPSSFSNIEIQNLVNKSLARNKEESNKINKKKKENSITYFTPKTMSFMQFNKKTGKHMKIGDATDFRVKKVI